MVRDQLRKSIKHLQDELADGDPLTPDDRARLERVLGEIVALLEHDGEEAPAVTGTTDELPSLVERFESTHPNVAAVLGHIADSLSQLGI